MFAYGCCSFAIAKVIGLTVVTRNVADFSSFGIELINPFEFRTKA
jgi:hypothetical protein